ncbi:MAG: mucoidy inhibitor MuiA family protein [Runella sp.]
MKTIVLTAAFMTTIAWAQRENTSKIVESKIETVTVYENGAQITRLAKTPLNAGRTTLTLKGISPQLDKQSLQVAGDFVILSVVHQTSFLSDSKKSEERTRLETQKENIEEKILTNNALLKVFQQEESLLIKNQDIKGNTTTLKAAELKEAADFHRSRLTEVLNKQLELQKANRLLEQEIKKINAQLTTLAPTQESTTSEIVIALQSNQPQAAAEVSVSYFVPNAGWTPTYDLRVRDISRPLEIGYKATVYQYSGEDWKNVKLILSTANPRKNNQSPILRPWYWGSPNNYSDYYNNLTVTASSDNEIIGTVRSNTDKTPLHGVSVLLKGTSLGTITDANGNYRITIPPDLKYKRKILIFNFIGYRSAEREAYNPTLNVDLTEETNTLNEVITTSRTSQARQEMIGAMAMATPPTAKRTQNLPIVDEREAPTSQQYEIKEPYTIPSDGKTYTVEIKNEEIEAYYEYYCIPKIDTDVFLTAHIINWEQYGLLGGEMNVFFEGVFVGKSSMTLPNSDTLSLSLGRDKNLIVSRIKQKSFSKRQVFGNSQSESRRYEITVRNAKKQAVNVVVVEQFPLSNTKEVEIQDTSAPEGEVNKSTGEVKWKFTLPAAQQRKLLLGYTVKYPKTGFVSTE